MTKTNKIMSDKDEDTYSMKEEEKIAVKQWDAEIVEQFYKDVIDNVEKRISAPGDVASLKNAIAHLYEAAVKSVK